MSTESQTRLIQRHPRKGGQGLIFVGGAPRSGTTLVQNILDSHPDICGAPEFHHVRDIVELREKIQTTAARGWIDEICTREGIDSYLCNLLEQFLLPIGEKTNSRFVSEKTPSNVLVFPQLLRICPEALFIHVVRDPRAVICSLLQVGLRAKRKGMEAVSRGLGAPRFTRDFLAAASYVQACHAAGFAASRMCPQRVLTVVYEQLVKETGSETRNICGFLGVKWCNEMLHPGKIRHLGEKPIANEIWYDSARYNRDPDPSEIDKWRRQLKSTYQIMAMQLFGDSDDLRRLGYQLTSNGVPMAKKIEAYALSKFGDLRKVIKQYMISFSRRVL